MNIKVLWNNLQVGFAAVGGWLGWILGGYDEFLYALIVFVIIDYITGIMASIVEKNLSSEIGFKGIFKKVLIFTMIAIGHILDSRIIGDGSTLRTAVIFFYLSNEGISIIENASRVGLPIPEKLKDILAQLNGKEEKDEANNKIHDE